MIPQWQDGSKPSRAVVRFSGLEAREVRLVQVPDEKTIFSIKILYDKSNGQLFGLLYFNKKNEIILKVGNTFK